MKYIGAIIAIITLVVIALGCTESGQGDAPLGPVDDTPASIVNNPDGFANIAFKCFKGNGIYVSTRPAPPVVIVNDPACQ